MKNDPIKPEIRALERTLKSIVAEFGDDAYSEFRVMLQQHMKHEFMSMGGEQLTESDKPPMVLRLKGKKEHEASGVRPPRCDHPEMFDWRGTPLCFVYHPYYMVSDDELKPFCEKHGLECEITPRSWYYLGESIRVVIYDPERRKEYAAAMSANREAKAK